MNPAWQESSRLQLNDGHNPFALSSLNSETLLTSQEAELPENHGLHRQYHSSSTWLGKLSDVIDPAVLYPPTVIRCQCALERTCRKGTMSMSYTKTMLEMEQLWNNNEKGCKKIQQYKHTQRHTYRPSVPPRRLPLRQAQLTTRTFSLFSSPPPRAPSALILEHHHLEITWPLSRRDLTHV